jgi:hypothetical protein
MLAVKKAHPLVSAGLRFWGMSNSLASVMMKDYIDQD